MPAFNERVLSTTQDELLPSAVDTVLGGNFIALRILGGKAKKWVGETLRRAVKYRVSPTGGSFSGLGNFVTNAEITKVRLAWNPTGYYQNITIPGIEKAVNAGTARVIDMVANAIEEATMDMLDGIGTIFYGTADGTGDDFTGLRNIVLDTGSVGGLARATYTTLQATVTASGGTMTLNNLSTLYSDISVGSSEANSPSVFVSNETVFNLYEALVRPTLRLNYGVMTMRGPMRNPEAGEGWTGGVGFRALTFKGKPWVADEKATAQTVFALNENYLDFYGLSHPDLKGISLTANTVEGGPYAKGEAASPNHGFQWTGFKVPVHQLAEIGQIILLGNLVSWNPKRHGRLTGVTAS